MTACPPWSTRQSYSADADARHSNMDKRADQQRAYYEANREKIADQRRAYYEANREKIADQQRAYREAQPGEDRGPAARLL